MSLALRIRHFHTSQAHDLKFSMDSIGHDGMGKMPGVGRMVKQGIYEVITDMHMPTGDFILRVGSPGVDHTLIWRNRKFNLSDTLAHKAVMFSGKPRSLLYQTWRSLWGSQPRLQTDKQLYSKEEK